MIVGGDTMKIAIGTDDQESIRKGYFGDSRYYLILEVRNAAVAGREWREDPDATRSKSNGHNGQPQRIIMFLGDCSIFLGGSFKEKFLQEISSRGIDCFLTEIEDINKAVSSYLDGQDEGFQYYDKEKKTFIPCSQRSLSKVEKPLHLGSSRKSEVGPSQ
jgi:predicted Fe-Mo cluster-binding NifX family protein